MVHADDGVIVSGRGFEKYGIGWKWPLSVDSLPAGILYGRCDLQFFFIAEKTLLASMWIQSGNRDPRCLNIEIRHERLVGDADQPQDRCVS